MDKACLRSGFCCKQAPCPYGEWNKEKTQCKHLIGDKPGEYACGMYEHIIKQPGSEVCPAFGAGCSSTLFNEDRDSLLTKGTEHDS